MANSEKKLRPYRTPFARSLLFQDSRLRHVIHVIEQLQDHDLSVSSPETIADLANNTQNAILSLLVLRRRIVTPEGIARESRPIALPRPVSVDAVNAVLECARNSGPNLFVMRHGAQETYDSDRDLDAARLKIVMMKNPRNSTDPVTDESLAEAGAQAVVLRGLQDRRKCRIRVVSSRTARAGHVGLVIAEALSTPLEGDPALDCLSYPDEPTEVINERLGPENKGALPWKEEIIDRVIGPGTYERLCRGTDRVVARGLTARHDTVVITHTQQTNRIDELVGQQPKRYGNLAFRVVTVTSRFHENGSFAKAA